ncbi:Citron rho-interacting kinase [Frankliniella fusca]|uniref:non-specific serine/threonine protein kinase n=1 Tax=Frankliniella fusca TaxID=407009 RepID=A0AAE1LP38_9NEOP|nr:Citron rho-interacting kinase [Frankliniella fusca]
MEPSNETLSVRITRIKNIIMGKTQDPNTRLLGQEGLIDSLLVLYDECNTDTMKKDANIAAFVEKFRAPVSEIRSMRVNISDFEVRKVIGRGHFGEVHLVREKQTGDAYAMKTLRKSDTLGNKRAFFDNERDIMATAVSPWITTLQYAFQDMHNLYLVMEFHPGGDLLGLLDRFGGRLSEEFSRFYLAEITSAIRALHQMGFVHRDIKPDNILLDRCGHIKLADFGSSAKLSSSGLVQAEMPVGTPEYLSPEVLQGIEATEGKSKIRSNPSRSPIAHPVQAYGSECDYWSLGIVAYEMAFGKTPFRSDQLATTYQHILQHKKYFKYPDHIEVSNDFKDMVSGLITEANSRLTYDHLIKHSFFFNVDWLSLRDIVPPHVPVVNGEDDTSNFFEFERVQPAPSIENFKSHKEFSGRNLPFVGFTFAKDPSAISNTSVPVDPHLERKLESKKKEIHGLLSKINALEGTSGRKNKDVEVLEKRAETAEQRLELVEQDRTRLETELARSRSEQQSLRRALDLEMQETKNMEARAMELIKSAKEKWDRLYAKEHKEKDKKIEQLTDQLTALNTANNNLISKVHRRDKELNSMRTEVSNLQDLVKEYKENMAKTRQSQRESVLDVQSRLNELATESQNQLAELQAKFDTESRKFEMYKVQVDRKRLELEKALEKSRLESKCLSDQLAEKSRQVKNLEQTRVAELEQKIQKGCAKCAVWQDRVASLESEISTSVMSFEQHETTIAEREEERNLILENACKEKAVLEKRVHNLAYKDQENKEKLESLEKLMKSLEGSISKLEEENSKLREQNSSLVKYKRRSSIGANGSIASPRASTTTTVTTTTIVAAKAEASLEPICNGKEDEGNNLQLQVMEANITKLESQLDKAKEAAILDRQAAQAARTDLWRKEKELADAKLDLRISEREVKILQEEVTKLKSEKGKLEEDIKKDREVKKADKDKISHLARELEMIQAELKQDKMSSSTLTDTLAAYKSELTAKESKVKQLEVDLTAANKQVSLLELQVSKTDETCHELRDEKRRILQQLDESQRTLQRLEVNSNVLKETCTMLEEQLEDFERLTSTHEAKEARLQEECSKLQADIEVAQSEIRLCKQAINEEKSLRAQAEARVMILETQLEESKSALTQVREQAAEYKTLAEKLTEQVNTTDEHTSQLEVSLHCAQRQAANLQAEVIGLKEEIATQLTRIHTLKETNLRLDQELEESVEEERSLLERVERLQSTIAEMEACHSHRQLKSDATLQQQAKLIDYLQQKLEEQGRRKKTLTDKLFGKRDKENQINSATIINAGVKELESQLYQERKKVQKLTEEIVRSSTRCPKTSTLEKEKEKIQTSSPESVLSPTAAKHLVLSPGSQAIKNQASLQRMHHNIPHRFEVKVIMKSSKCAACQDGLPFGRQATMCAECGIAAHHRCTALLPSTCGLPSGFARHFSQRWKKSKEGQINGDRTETPCSSAVNIEGWMKLPTRGNSCWERRYVRLAGSELLIFAHEPANNSAHMSPIERYPLCPADGITTVSSATQAEIVGTAKSDIPFIIKIEVTPRTTCWPGSTQYLMALSGNEKEKWMEALKAAARAGEALRGNTTVDRSRKYCGQVMARLPQDKKLDVACVMHMSQQVVLLGAEEGLFSYHLGKDKPKPIKIGGVGSVYQIAVLANHGIVVLISGKNRDLLYCEFGQLKSCAEAAECTQAALNTKRVFPTNCNSPESCFQLLATAKPNQSGTTSDILCAASTKRIFIFKWNTFSLTGFQQLKVLETQEPCSCILLTPHSIIVGCNKFFEIDAQDFSVEDFLDVSDKSLSHLIALAKKTNSYPSAILDVTVTGGRCSPEYLVCFHEVGVFVDQYGRRSREEDLKWGHVPFAFAFRKPFLFIFHFASVEVMRLSGTSFTRNLNDSGSTISECPPSSVIELNNPQYLGDTISPGGVYACNLPANGVEVVRIEGSLACPDELGYSCTSLETASDNGDTAGVSEVQDVAEFSFTSSIVQSLDEESYVETEDARSSSHHDSDNQSSSNSDVHSRHVHFHSASSSTLHTAM